MSAAATEHPAARPPRRRMAVSTALFALATGLSRIAGLVREVVAAVLFGVQGAGINAFLAAFTLPNLVRALVADAALGAAFVPVFNQLLERGERERAWRVASTVFWLSFAGLTAITLVFMALAPQLMELFNTSGEFDVGLAAGLARVMFPIVVLLGLSGLAVAILNTFEEFFVPAVAPVAWNAIIIGALLAAVPVTTSTEGRLYAYAVGVLVGTAVQFALPLPWLRGRGGRIALRLDVRDPAVRRVFALMLPVTLGVGLINLNLLVDQFFGSLIAPALALAAIDKAFRVYILPQGIFSVAVAAVLFPALSRYAAARDMDRFRDTVASGLRQIAFLLLPASAVCAVLAEPIIRLLYQWGQFSAGQTPVVARCLAAFSAGLAFNGAMLLLNRAFFSLQLTWTATCVAIGNLILNGAFDAAFYHLGIWGIPLATSVVNVVSVVALLWYLRRVVGPLDERRTAAVVARIAGCAVLLAAVAYPCWRLLDAALGRSLPAQAVSLLLALLAGGAAYLGAARVLRLEELRALESLRRRRRKG